MGPATSPAAADGAAEEHRRLLEFLRDRDARCPLCRYNLRNLTRPECPECRQPLVLTVGIEQVRFGWFLLTVTPGLFSGLCAPFLLVPIVASVMAGNGPPWHIYATDAFGWLSGLAAVTLIACRYRFLRLPIRIQVMVAAASWAVHILAFLALLAAAFLL